MKLKYIFFICCLVFFSFQANAQVELQLDHVAGLTRCSFKESKNGDYSYCGDKIKNIFITVNFSGESLINPNPKSISVGYIYKYISGFYKSLDDQVDELKYDVSFIPPGKWDREKNKKHYLYLHAKFFPLKNNKIICVLFFDRNGNHEIDSFLIDISTDDADDSFKKELEKIDTKLSYELISRKGM